MWDKQVFQKRVFQSTQASLSDNDQEEETLSEVWLKLSCATNLVVRVLRDELSGVALGDFPFEKPNTEFISFL